jgi:outer membrane protein TolC
VQWGGGRAQVEAARADQDRVEYATRANREALQHEVYYTALQLTQAGRQLAIAAKADTVADKRFEVAKNRYVIGKIGIGDLYIAQSEKDGALLSYVQSLRGFWLAYYGIRRLTLYDFVVGRAIDPS